MLLAPILSICFASSIFGSSRIAFVLPLTEQGSRLTPTLELDRQDHQTTSPLMVQMTGFRDRHTVVQINDKALLIDTVRIDSALRKLRKDRN